LSGSRMEIAGTADFCGGAPSSGTHHTSFIFGSSRTITITTFRLSGCSLLHLLVAQAGLGRVPALRRSERSPRAVLAASHCLL
jgi:hypothetical protein